jgi:hypothetical protein
VCKPELLGSVSGLSPKNAIILADLTWISRKMKATFSGDTSGGTLTVCGAVADCGIEHVHARLIDFAAECPKSASRTTSSGLSDHTYADHTDRANGLATRPPPSLLLSITPLLGTNFIALRMTLPSFGYELRSGTPQGGVISPLLANLFLHHAFDMWMART